MTTSEPQTQRLIDEEIATQRSSLRDLVHARNTLSPISRLPPSILEGIFLQSARRFYETYSSSMMGLPSWVNVSYVCRDWRNVALDSAILWTYLFMVSRRWTEELLARSKGAPLKLRVEIGHPLQNLLKCFKMVEDQAAERIEELHIVIWSEDKYFADAVYGPFLNPFKCPHLKVLEIQTMKLMAMRLTFEFAHGIRFPISALAPLVLTKRNMPWYSPKPSGLTSLVLEWIPPALRPTAAELQSMLRLMPAIVFIQLSGALSSTDDYTAKSDSAVSDRVNLPRLSCLLIKAPGSAMVAFLSGIIIPLRTELRLECDEHKYGVEDDDSDSDMNRDENETRRDKDYSSLFSLLSQRFYSSKDQVSPAPTIRTVFIDDPELVFSASESGHPPPKVYFQFDERDGCRYDIPLQLAITEKTTRIQTADVILRAVPSKHVQRLHIGYYRQEFATISRNALAHFQEIRYLCIANGALISELSVLVSGDHDVVHSEGGSVGQGSRLLYAPALEELVLDSCKCDGNELKRMLSIRKEQGRALKKLVIADCTISEFEPGDMPVDELCVEESSTDSEEDENSIKEDEGED